MSCSWSKSKSPTREVDEWSMNFLIREAEVEDAQVLLALLDQIGQESTFTSLDENGISISQSEMERFIDKQAQSDNQITLLAFFE